MTKPAEITDKRNETPEGLMIDQDDEMLAEATSEASNRGVAKCLSEYQSGAQDQRAQLQQSVAIQSDRDTELSRMQAREKLHLARIQSVEIKNAKLEAENARMTATVATGVETVREAEARLDESMASVREATDLVRQGRLRVDAVRGTDCSNAWRDRQNECEEASDLGACEGPELVDRKMMVYCRPDEAWMRRKLEVEADTIEASA